MGLHITSGDVLFQRGVQLQQAGRLQEAMPIYEAALRENFEHRGALYNLAILLIHMGDPQRAMELLRCLLALEPRHLTAYNALGEAQRRMGMLPQALESFDKAIAVNPALPSAHNNRALVQSRLGQSGAAIESWQRALALAGDSPETRGLRAAIYGNLGNACLTRSEIGAAIDHLRRACELDPQNFVHNTNLLRCMVHADDIANEALREAHVDWWKRHTAGISPAAYPPGGDPEKKLRIGLLSPDFCDHPVACFLTSLIESHDREHFEFYCYSNTPIPDATTERFVRHSARFHNIAPLTDEQTATLIQNDKIDILIDLAGHTAHHRLHVFARKPAPVQVTYLGYPHTTGSSLMDWRLTDALADPPGMTDSHFVERLWRLPRCAWCYSPPVDVAAEEAPPSSRGGPFTFASFNNYSKVTDRAVALWARILQQVPDARLLLKSVALRDESVRGLARARFAHAGVSADRLLFSGHLDSLTDHLALYRTVDLALDTFPYNGTTTTCEALWMNVPVVALAGTSHASRVGVSLLSAVGLQPLIADTEDQYVAIACEAARNPGMLSGFRSGLRGRMRNSPLMNGPDFAESFCNAVRAMWRQHVTR